MVPVGSPSLMGRPQQGHGSPGFNSFIYAIPFLSWTGTTGFPRSSLGAPARTQLSHRSSKAWTSGVRGQLRNPRFCRTVSFFSSSSKV